MDTVELLTAIFKSAMPEDIAKALTSAGLSAGGELYPKQIQSPVVPADQAVTNIKKLKRIMKEVPEAAGALPPRAQEIFKKAFESTDPAWDDVRAYVAAWAAVNEEYIPSNGGVDGWVVKRFTDPQNESVDHLRRQLLTDGYPEAASSLENKSNPDLWGLVQGLPEGYRDTILDRYATLLKSHVPVLAPAQMGDPEAFEMEVAFKAILPAQKITYGVVYPAYDHSKGERDLQKEWARVEVIEDAAHKFLTDWRQQDIFHNEQAGFGTPVESYIAPCDISEFHGKVLEKPIRKGSWIMATKWADGAWDMVQNGKINGYSIGGFKRVRRD